MNRERYRTGQGWRAAAATVLCLVVGLGLDAGARAQETRGTILGTVRDTTGGVLAGMNVVVTNEDTNVSNEAVTNARGAYEIPYLLPGSYRVVVQADGFKKFTQTGLVLTVNSRVDVPVTLAVGNLTDEVTVTSDVQLLETTTASASSTLTNRQVNSLPMFGNSALLLARSVPGVQWTAAPNYLGLHSNVGASGVSAAGGVGGTEYSLDGVPNAGPSRRVAYLPYTDTINEIKIETAGFDASKGHSSGANISMLTKSGTNQFHGSGTWQYWNQDWNATQSTTNAAYYGRIAAAEAAGNTAEATRLRGERKVPEGKHHNWAGVLGGPVRLPKFDGSNKLFFFFSYNGFKDVKVEEPAAVNRTVPTEAQRRGDFSELLAIDPVRYQLYDPRTARLENGRVVRDPFPNNQVPSLNPLYDEYLRYFPLPNNPAGIVSREGANNYLASGTPYNWDYKAFSNRVDWNVSPRHRSFARWSYNYFLEDRGDWTYETARGLHTNGLVRKNIGATIDHVFLQNSRTVWNVSMAYNRFTEGNQHSPAQLALSPSTVGLPAYVQDRANESPCTLLPRLEFSAYDDMGVGCFGWTNYSIGTVRAELNKFFGTHSVKSGVDLRKHWRSNIPGGNTSTEFQFRNNFVRQRDDTNNAGTLGLEWASFMLGVPTAINIDRNDSYYLTNPYYAAYVQDDWRIGQRLTLNLGVRYEYEGGFRERYDRGIGGGFTFGQELPISAAAEAAYLRNPIPGLASIDVAGGNTYLGLGVPRSLSDGQHDVMPRLGAVFKMNDKTVIRGGYGLFFDTNNVLNEGINQFGYSRGTGTVLSNNNGLTFNNTNLTSAACRATPAACQTIFSDPFPVRADGTRFNTPLGNGLGEMALVGRGEDFVPREWQRARQHRWRLGVQRELSRTMVLEAAYLGSYADSLALTQRLDYLPEEFWADGNARNDTVANFLNGTVPNPFNIANFEFLRTQDPTLYNDMANSGFFTSTTIRRHQLLRAYPHMTAGNGLRNTRVPDGRSRYHHVELSLQRRMSKGVEYTVAYTRAWDERRDFYENEFDRTPIWRISNTSLPHHLMVTTIAELPFGDGKPWLSTGVGKALLGGWQVSGIYHLQSGRVIDWGNPFYYGSSYEAIALPRGERDRARWFNTADFERASARQPASFHRRVFPQRLDFLRTDYMNQLDLSLQREFRLPNRTRFQVRADAVNALNNVQWDGPNTDPTSSNFGVVTTQYNTPRWIQVQGRFTF
jgi:hypothetical protein